jgi:aryl-alcohol dehydrogenase-like predicted oxidoreductase
VISGHATAEGTARYAARFPARQAAGFYRLVCGLSVSSLGLGTYLGAPDEPTDRAYTEAVGAALAGGINFLDTAINYRHQRSERSIGAALIHARRDEVVISTKAGFLTPGAVPASLGRDDVAGGMHSMAPDFLADQIDRSRANLDIDTIDIFYLHNPETQLGFVSHQGFEERVRRAFARLEQLASANRIRYYGMATWEGFRKADALDLGRIAELAKQEGGAQHHFRFIQLPFNLGMVEAYTQKPKSVLGIATREGIAVIASATLLQSQLADGLPQAIAERLPGLATDAQRAIQFTRSTPGVTVALVGMSRASHVAENLGIAIVAPATPEQYQRLYD